MREMKRIYLSIEDKIQSRLDEFRTLWEKGSEEEIFAELVFCLLTSQCRPQPCWKAVKALIGKNLLFEGDETRIAEELNGARFKYRKASYIIEARNHFSRGIRSIINGFDDVYAAREWLVENVKGMGYKEASHFLRNIGLGEDLAILDRHVLKNLQSLGVIEVVPHCLTKKRYLEIEEKMRGFAKESEIPLSHLDLVLWYKGTGEIFK